MGVSNFTGMSMIWASSLSLSNRKAHTMLGGYNLSGDDKVARAEPWSSLWMLCAVAYRCWVGAALCPSSSW